MQGFFSKKIFRSTLSLTQENHHFIVQIRKNKCSQWKKLPRTCTTSYYTAHNNFQIGMRLCSLSSYRFFFLLLVSVARCRPFKNHEFTYTEGLNILTGGPTNFINIKISVACSMLKDVPFFVRRTALLVSLYITKHLFLPTYAT